VIILTSLNQHQIGGAFCDLTKVPDCVKHNILLHKLYYYRIRGVWYHWFTSLSYKKETNGEYITTFKRRKFIKLGNGNQCSPQDPIVGRLFIININDLPHGTHHEAKPVIYADDTSILLIAKSAEGLKIKINFILDHMIDWFLVNGLVLNIEETHTAKFTSSCCHNEPFQITYQNKEISGAKILNS
jgi:hypothetical protein